MQTYELTYIITPEISSEEAEAKSKEIESAIQGNEGVVVSKTSPVAKALAQPIKNRASGFLGILEFKIEPEKLSAIQELVKKDEKITRHIVLVKKPIKIRKERRAKKGLLGQILEVAQKKDDAVKQEAAEPVLEEKQEEKKESKAKVELKDIEERLDEILGE